VTQWTLSRPRDPDANGVHPPVDAERAAEPAPSTEGRVFANCAAVRAAGLGPLRRGTADYEANPNLDRDEDGRACE
jgi:hypothetical protein